MRPWLTRLGIGAVAVIVGVAGVVVWNARSENAGYHVTAYFDSAVALYPQSHVIVMGARIGTVDSVELEDTRVRVEMTIDDGVPLPADVSATIEPLQIIGERNVVMFPAWNPDMATTGTGRLGDGDVIPVTRTVTPVEPDEGLTAFNDLAEALDPDVVSSLVEDSAAVLEGRGSEIGASLGNLASISESFAAVDDQLVAIAESVHVLTSRLDEREDQITTLIEGFSTATEVLASERESITRLVESLVALTEEGSALLDAYGGHLPQDVANLAAFTLVLNDNISSLQDLFSAFPLITDGLADAYDPDVGGIALKGSLTPTVTAILESLTSHLERLLAGGAGP